MKNFLLFLGMLWLTLCVGCSVVGGIFKAGVWVGVIICVAVVGIIIWLITRGSKKS